MSQTNLPPWAEEFRRIFRAGTVSQYILYGSLFTAAETSFLLSKPVRDDQVFAYKFQGAVAFSSWAFLLLGGPVLIAYGLVCAAPLSFYAFLIAGAFFIGLGIHQRRQIAQKQT